MTAWTPLDLDNPPHHTMVGLCDDGCSVCVVVRLDDGTWVYAEDGETAHFLSEYSWWTPAAPEFHPHFMNVTQDDWY